jgi:hypothetical protein
MNVEEFLKIIQKIILGFGFNKGALNLNNNCMKKQSIL